MHADRTNRTLLIILALALIAGGGLGAARSLGAFGSKAQHSTLSHNSVWSYYGAHGDWLWPLTGLAALVLLVLALRWLAALLFTTDRSGDLRIPTASGEGRTTLNASAFGSAVAEEIQTYRGVTSAKARVVGDPDDPRLVVTATVDGSTSFTVVRNRIETGALTHARQALAAPDLPIRLDLRVVGADRSASLR